MNIAELLAGSPGMTHPRKRTRVLLAGNYRSRIFHRGTLPESLWATLTTADLILVAAALDRSFVDGMQAADAEACANSWIWDTTVGHGREIANRDIIGPKHGEDLDEGQGTYTVEHLTMTADMAAHIIHLDPIRLDSIRPDPEEV